MDLFLVMLGGAGVLGGFATVPSRSLEAVTLIRRGRAATPVLAAAMGAPGLRLTGVAA